MANDKYPLTELVERWEEEDLTTKQVIDQILLWLVYFSRRIAKLEARRSSGKAPKG